MERLIFEKLYAWKNDSRRKPLILRGVRQCGKTWALKEFGRQAFAKTAYFSFEENPEYKEIFENTRNAKRILDQLTLASGIAIDPADTLIIFDEIQECPDALASLKYFCENALGYAVACAGSLLGIRMKKDASFPVGKVDFLDMGPMNFTEFLMADGCGHLADYMASIDRIETIPEVFFNPLSEKLKQYFVIGGMPEAIDVWSRYRNPGLADKVQRAILGAYDLDFAKHLSDADARKASVVWRSLPKQLGREHKKFTYQLVRETARARDYELPIEWLARADLIHRIYRNNATGLPLSAGDDFAAFKLYAADVGLLRCLAQLDANALTLGHELFAGYKGAFSENYISEALSSIFDVPLRYWSQTKPPLEVDFLIQYGTEIIPVEVKAGKDSKGKGLAVYRERHAETTTLRIRFSMLNLNLTDDVLNIPLFMADRTQGLIDMAKEAIGNKARQ